MATGANDVNVNVNNESTSRVDARQKEYDARGYKVLCIGNSLEDLVIITVCILTLWGLTAAFYLLLLHAALSTDTTGTALWLFFGMFFTGVCFLILILVTSEVERKLRLKHSKNIV